jgi:hypothetical protein
LPREQHRAPVLALVLSATLEGIAAASRLSCGCEPPMAFLTRA